MKAVVVADGDVPERAALDSTWPGWADGIGLVIAADGGAVGARRLGLSIDLLVGDMDSLSPDRLDAIRAAGTEVLVVPAEKDESDAELAVVAAVERGATDVTILGAFGGPRLDHTLANIGLLALSSLAGRDAQLLDGTTRVTALVAPAGGPPVRRALAGRPGDLVSLLPLGGDAIGVTTAGLRYPLSAESLLPGPARGLSNVRTDAVATVELERGLLVLVETAVVASADDAAEAVRSARTAAHG